MSNVYVLLQSYTECEAYEPYIEGDSIIGLFAQDPGTLIMGENLSIVEVSTTSWVISVCETYGETEKRYHIFKSSLEEARKYVESLKSQDKKISSQIYPIGRLMRPKNKISREERRKICKSRHSRLVRI